MSPLRIHRVPTMRSRSIMALALEARICQASARKALKLGPHSLRGDAGARAAEAMQRLGLRPDVASAAPAAHPPAEGDDAAAE